MLMQCTVDNASKANIPKIHVTEPTFKSSAHKIYQNIKSNAVQKDVRLNELYAKREKSTRLIKAHYPAHQYKKDV